VKRIIQFVILFVLSFFVGTETHGQSALVKKYSYYYRYVNDGYGNIYQDKYNLNADGNGSLVRTITYSDRWAEDYGYQRSEEIWIWRVKGTKKWADYSKKYYEWLPKRTPLPNIQKTIPNESQPPLFNLAGNRTWSVRHDDFGIITYANYYEEGSLTYHYSGDIKPVDNVFYGVQQGDDNPNQSVDMFKELVSVSGTGDISLLAKQINGMFDVVNYYRLYIDIQ
jgi:hypothetical protein